MGFPDVIHLVEVVRHSLTSFHFPAGELPLLDKSPSSVFFGGWGLSTLKKFLLALLLQPNFYYYFFSSSMVSVVLESPMESLVCCKFSFMCDCLPRLALTQFLLDNGERCLGFHWLRWFYSLRGLSVCTGRWDSS